MLTLPDGRRIAVELELSPKKSVDYERCLKHYAGLQFRPETRCAVWWFSDRPAILARLRQVVDVRKLGDVVTVAPLPEGITVRRWK